MSSSTIIKMTATVLWPSSEPSPSPTMNPMAASSSSQSPELDHERVRRGQENGGVARVIRLAIWTAAALICAAVGVGRSGPGSP